MNTKMPKNTKSKLPAPWEKKQWTADTE